MYLAGRLPKCCLWMAKQSTLNSKLGIIIVNHGGHFWQWFNLSNTKGHICQMDAGKPQSPRFQNTPCHICHSVCETARWKKKKKRRKNMLLYAFSAFCSHHRYNFWLQKCNREGFCEQAAEIHILICKIQAVSNCCKHNHHYGVSAVRGCAEDPWAVPTQHEGLYAAFVTVRDIGHPSIPFAALYAWLHWPSHGFSPA